MESRIDDAMQMSFHHELKVACEQEGSGVVVPPELLTALEKNVLLLNVFTIKEDFLNPLKSLLSTKLAKTRITSIMLCEKQLTVSTRKNVGKINATLQSKLISTLITILIKFIPTSTTINTLIFDSLTQLKNDHLKGIRTLLSKSNTVKWLCFRNCNVGDTGLCTLIRPLLTLSLQVLVFENCQLTDDACPLLCNIIKAHEARMDTKAWNMYLRLDIPPIPPSSSSSPSSSSMSPIKLQEQCDIHKSGLIALNLKGNGITSSGLQLLVEVIQRNNWLLGLKLSRNQLDESSIAHFIHSLTSHCGLHTLNLEENPGYIPSIIHSIQHSKVLCKQKVLKQPLISLLPETVQLLLSRWHDKTIEINQKVMTSYVKKPIESHNPPTTAIIPITTTIPSITATTTATSMNEMSTDIMKPYHVSHAMQTLLNSVNIPITNSHSTLHTSPTITQTSTSYNIVTNSTLSTTIPTASKMTQTSTITTSSHTVDSLWPNRKDMTQQPVAPSSSSSSSPVYIKDTHHTRDSYNNLNSNSNSNNNNTKVTSKKKKKIKKPPSGGGISHQHISQVDHTQKKKAYMPMATIKHHHPVQTDSMKPKSAYYLKMTNSSPQQRQQQQQQQQYSTLIKQSNSGSGTGRSSKKSIRGHKFNPKTSPQDQIREILEQNTLKPHISSDPDFYNYRNTDYSYGKGQYKLNHNYPSQPMSQPYHDPYSVLSISATNHEDYLHENTAVPSEYITSNYQNTHNSYLLPSSSTHLQPSDDLSFMLNITKNLEMVSTSLAKICQNVSDSVQTNVELQKSLSMSLSHQSLPSFDTPINLSIINSPIKVPIPSYDSKNNVIYSPGNAKISSSISPKTASKICSQELETPSVVDNNESFIVKESIHDYQSRLIQPYSGDSHDHNEEEKEEEEEEEEEVDYSKSNRNPLNGCHNTIDSNPYTYTYTNKSLMTTSTSITPNIRKGTVETKSTPIRQCSDEEIDEAINNFLASTTTTATITTSSQNQRITSKSDYFGGEIKGRQQQSSSSAAAATSHMMNIVDLIDDLEEEEDDDDDDDEDHHENSSIYKDSIEQYEDSDDENEDEDEEHNKEDMKYTHGNTDNHPNNYNNNNRKKNNLIYNDEQVEENSDIDALIPVFNNQLRYEQKNSKTKEINANEPVITESVDTSPTELEKALSQALHEKLIQLFNKI